MATVQLNASVLLNLCNAQLGKAEAAYQKDPRRTEAVTVRTVCQELLSLCELSPTGLITLTPNEVKWLTLPLE